MSRADFMKFLPKKPEKEPEHRFVLRVPVSLWPRLVAAAKDLDVSVNDLLVAAIESSLGKKS